MLHKDILNLKIGDMIKYDTGNSTYFAMIISKPCSCRTPQNDIFFNVFVLYESQFLTFCITFFLHGTYTLQNLCIFLKYADFQL